MPFHTPEARDTYYLFVAFFAAYLLALAALIAGVAWKVLAAHS